MKGSKGLILFLCAAAAPLVAHTAPLSGSAHYVIVEGGNGNKPLGEARYTVEPFAGGYTLLSSGQMALGSFQYKFENKARVDSSLNLVDDTLSGTVKGTTVDFSTASDQSGRELQIRVNASGKQTTNTVDRHRNSVLVPDLDPAAYLLMVHIASTRPNTAWALIPKENGLLVPATYLPKPDLTGTLNGAPVSVKHLTAVLGVENAVTLELYFTPDEQLLETDLSLQNFYVIRDGFKLTNRPAPTPPPPGEAPQQAPGPAPQQLPGEPQQQQQPMPGAPSA